MRKGFTLVELAIVVIIIGFVVVGVFAGKELIYTSNINKVITQKSEFNIAVNSFSTKYDCLPGDCANAYEYKFGTDVNGHGSYGENGDGNGIIKGNEQKNFWYHLVTTGFITGTFTDSTNTCTSSPCLSSQFYDPKHKRTGGWWITYSSYPGYTTFELPGLKHYFMLTTSILPGGSGGGGPVLIPQEAYDIDIKADDGLPMSGNVLALDVGADALVFGFRPATPGPGGASASVCVSNSVTPNVYNTLNAARTVANMCGLVLKAGF